MDERMTMTLAEWMEENGYGIGELAREMGVNGSMVSRWRSGLEIPSRESMVLIYEATKGQVDPNSFYDLPQVA